MPLPGARLCIGNKKDGTQCKNVALLTSVYCRNHIPTVEKMERNRPIFGQGESKLKLPDEKDQVLLESVLAGLQAEFTLNNSSDMINLEMAAYYFVKWRRAVEDGEHEKTASLDSLVQRNLSALQVTRSTRPSGESTVRTVADVQTDLLEKAKVYEDSELDSDE